MFSLPSSGSPKALANSTESSSVTSEASSNSSRLIAGDTPARTCRLSVPLAWESFCQFARVIPCESEQTVAFQASRYSGDSVKCPISRSCLSTSPEKQLVSRTYWACCGPPLGLAAIWQSPKANNRGCAKRWGIESSTSFGRRSVRVKLRIRGNTPVGEVT